MNQPAHDPKKVEYYAAQVNAWFQTSLERDKSLLALSTAGIGVLIALLTRDGARTTTEAVLFILALLSFTSCALVVLTIFSKNQAHLEAEIHKRANHVERHLKLLDNAALISFGAGISLALVIGIFTVISSTHGDTKMPSKEINIADIVKAAEDGRIIESFANSSRIAPPADDVKSFAGSGRVAPPEPAPQQPAAPTSQQPDSTATPATPSGGDAPSD